MKHTRELSSSQRAELFGTLEARFNKQKHRHAGVAWADVRKRLESRTDKVWTLFEMERSGGEPDVVGYDDKTGEYIFYDCSAESPKERRSACYDEEARVTRKEHAPKTSAVEMAAAMGIELMTEEQYRHLQSLGSFDSKTSSWILTPPAVRELGGALFGDFRFGRVFVYHNGAQSYYAARGFRGVLRV